MICEVVAVGTELLLGPSVDSNSAWIGERLAENGIASYFHTVVGDNRQRIVEALGHALSRSDAVIVTGGLGPTQDDITRECIAELMGVKMFTDERIAQDIRNIFATRNRPMSDNNLRQAMRPEGSVAIEQTMGTAPGVMMSTPDGKVIYALPGVPTEMKVMMESAVLPDLRTRAGEASVILSRVVRTWGTAESTVAEMVAPRVDALEAAGNPTIAFLAHGLEGIHVRVTARADSRDAALVMLDHEEAQLRSLLGHLVFGVDDETMEFAVGALVNERGWTLATAESLTGGLIAERLTDVVGASQWFKGGVVTYASEVKFDVLSVPEGPVVSADAAAAMATGVCDLLKADVGVAVTGVAGPTPQEGQPVGLVFAAVALPGSEAQTFEFRLNGSRRRVREFACINTLDSLRRLLGQAPKP